MNMLIRLGSLTSLILILLFSAANGQSRKEIRVPDILGYQTLKCDFHMHTVFSDGDVWPTVRVEEAWTEGLDVIAITDHIRITSYNVCYTKLLRIWSSPAEVKKIAKETCKALVDVLPEHKAVFSENLAKFEKEIDELDAELKSIFDQLPSKKFLIFHPALTYLARDYGLEQIAMEVEGKEPSPRHLKELAEIANNENIKAIFVQKEFNLENARQMAKEIGGQVIQVDPLNENWADELRSIAQKIAEAEKVQ